MSNTVVDLPGGHGDRGIPCLRVVLPSILVAQPRLSVPRIRRRVLVVGPERRAVTLIPAPDEQRAWFYLLRVAAYLLIAVAIIRKNTRDPEED